MFHAANSLYTLQKYNNYEDYTTFFYKNVKLRETSNVLSFLKNTQNNVLRMFLDSNPLSKDSF